MPNLYTLSTKKVLSDKELSDGERFSVLYHNLFDYPLSFNGLIKWRARGRINTRITTSTSITCKNNYYFLENRYGLVYKNLLRKRISAKKMLIAQRAAKIISLVPTVKMVAITGSLAMENSTDESDIDLLIITNIGTLWFTRLFAYLLIGLFGIQRRYPNKGSEKDRLCLNMWLDENDLKWNKKQQNFYTAHEIAQIIPLVNKDNTYEKFLHINKWILDYWPNSVRIKNNELRIKNKTKNSLFIIHESIFNVIEWLAFKLQYNHMASKITRETITKTRALFHPQDWGEVVLKRLINI